MGPGASGETTGIWAISIFNEPPRKLREDAGRAVVSPNGSQIAFIGGRSESEIWVMGANGESPRKLLQAAPGERFLQVQWSHSGARVAYMKSRTNTDKAETVIETVPLSGGDVSTILSAPGLQSFCWSSEGRIVYSLLEPPPNDREMNLWELGVDLSGSRATGVPRRLTSWAGLSVLELSASADGKQLVFVNSGFQNDLYVAGLEGKASLGEPRRFTLEGRNNLPSAWTPDGQALLFSSDRNGNWDIFSQGLRERNARDFVLGPGAQIEPRISPDALSVLYWDSAEKEGGVPTPMRLLRVPISGGAPELVLEAGRGAAVRCARGRPRCVLSELDRGNSKLVFTALDLRGGKGSEFLRLACDPAGAPAWDLSPDGSTVAIVGLDEHKNHIRVVDLEGGSARSIPARPSERLSGISWSGDGRGLFVTSTSLRGAAIFYVDGNGAVSELWKTNTILGTPLASPDGKNLAFTVSTHNSNAWVMQNF